MIPAKLIKGAKQHDALFCAMTAGNIISFYRNGTPPTCVNPEVLDADKTTA